MTLPKKGSRTIEVDGVPLRYVVSMSMAGEAGLFPLHITVQSATGRGRLLRAHGPTTRDRWLDFPEVERAEKYATLKPGDVAAVVRLARAGGWDPEEIGAPFLFEIESGAIQARSAAAEKTGDHGRCQIAARSSCPPKSPFGWAAVAEIQSRRA